jgi:hypothetical protein
MSVFFAVPFSIISQFSSVLRLLIATVQKLGRTSPRTARCSTATAVLIGTPDAILTDHFNNKKQKPVICVVPQFLGDTTDTTVDQVYNSIRDDLGDQAFLCLHVIPNKVGRILIDIHERGQTLDVVKTTYEATYALVKRNRNLATIKIFTPMMAAMAGSVGYMFDSFWHVQQYHFDRGNDRYYLLFDSKDL